MGAQKVGDIKFNFTPADQLAYTYYNNGNIYSPLEMKKIYGSMAEYQTSWMPTYWAGE